MTSSEPLNPFSSPSDLLVELMRRRLARLSYLGLLLVVEKVLTQSGYDSVRLLGRRHMRGRTATGGADMSARTNADRGRTLTLIQVKRFDRPVSRRYVDELRGAMLRKEAPDGLLVTTSTFSRPAVQAAIRFHGRPIRLMDGEQLARFMIHTGLGTTETRDILTGERTQIVDELAFREVERLAETIRNTKHTL